MKKKTKKIRPFDEQNTKLAMGKGIQKIPRVSIKEQIESGEKLDAPGNAKRRAREHSRYLRDFGSETSVYGRS
jgi:hypothetical protein